MKLIYTLLSLVLLTACGSPVGESEFDRWVNDQNKVRVLCTIGMLDDLVQQVGGERVNLLTLINGQLDPHSYELVKGDDEKLREATLVFYNGLGLEHGPSLRSYLEGCEKCTSVGDYIASRDPDAPIFIDGQLDPHIWTDLSLYAIGVDAIVQSLSEIDPEGSEFYQANGRQLQSDMLKKHEEIRGVLHQIPSNKRFLVTSHDAFNYFARAYLMDDSEKGTDEWRVRFEAPEGLSPESQLSPLDIQRLIDHLNRYQVTVLFAESNVSRDSVNKIVDAGGQKGLKLHIAQEVLFADAMGEPGGPGDTYLKMMEHNARVIARYLDGM